MLILSPVSYSKEKLILGYTEWGNFGGNDKPDLGYYVDVVESILEFAGYEVESKIMTWSKAIMMSRQHQVDILPAVWLDKEQYPYLYFMEDAILNNDKISFIVKKSRGFKSGKIESFRGMRVGYYGAGAYGSKLRKARGFDRFNIRDIEQALEMLLEGRIDAYLSDPETALSTLKEFAPKMLSEIEVLEPEFILKKVVPAIAINHPKRKEIVDKFMKSYLEIKIEDPEFFIRMAEKHNVKIFNAQSQEGD